ncbi:hypothetical protein PAECIP111893_02186 [Paenibacillus plantiphilus]|uniref:M23ase beta-sheet core domain-containing protein n=1 Tax=Paenibacillus plantiphilus TaxID=2905650 RepID=A0ABN8GFK8_9BACL|nr:M23 family metallopeptidase [Paenibacillus plantiphilus]CAH1204205.1 hypothetical protein PAECIP111893_02186 [Paenibacillus plantiphilus]
MDAKKGVRERRQERIREIMNAKQSMAMTLLDNELPHQNIGPQPPAGWKSQPLPEVLHIPKASSLDAAGPDPEQLWKSQANPWESAGWRMARDARASVGIKGGEQRDPIKRYPSFIRGFFIQTIVSAALFFIIVAMFRIDMPQFKRGQEFVAVALTDNIDFDTAAAWYDATFAGAPSFIPLFGGDDSKESKLVGGDVSLPVVAPLNNGTVVRTFAETLGGVEIAGESEERVSAVETGRVLLVTQDEKAGKTVVLQHMNERQTIYGGIEKAAVAVGDWVEGGNVIGTLPAAGENESSLLFFAVKQKNRYVNPADVVPLD